MTENSAYVAARKRVRQLRGWYIHVTAFVAVNVGLFAIDLIEGDGLNWAYWTLLGWGIGVSIHTARVWFRGFRGFKGPLGDDWEERKIRELMDRDESSRSS